MKNNHPSRLQSLLALLTGLVLLLSPLTAQAAGRTTRSRSRGAPAPQATVDESAARAMFSEIGLYFLPGDSFREAKEKARKNKDFNCSDVGTDYFSYYYFNEEKETVNTELEKDESSDGVQYVFFRISPSYKAGALSLESKYTQLATKMDSVLGAPFPWWKAAARISAGRAVTTRA